MHAELMPLLVALLTLGQPGNQTYHADEVPYSARFGTLNGAVIDWEAEENAKQDGLRRDLRKAPQFWLRELESGVAKRGDRAAAVLMEAAELVMDADAKETPQAKRAIYIAGEPVKPSLFRKSERNRIVSRYRQAFRDAAPKLITRLKNRIAAHHQDPPHAAPPVSESCLAAAWSDGSGITRAWRAIPPSPGRDGLIVSYLLCSINTIPDDALLHPTVVQALQECSPRTKGALNAQWQELLDGKITLPSFNLGLAAMVCLRPLIDRDRTQRELPMLREALKPGVPQPIRAFALVCAFELGAEVESLKPIVQQVLRSPDEDKVIKKLAAAALTQIDLDESKVEAIADLASLKGRDRDEFIRNAKQQIRDSLFHELNFAESAPMDLLRGLLRFGNGCEKRFALRIIRHHGPGARALRHDVQALLADSVPETSRFARLALTAIDRRSR